MVKLPGCWCEGIINTPDPDVLDGGEEIEQALLRDRVKRGSGPLTSFQSTVDGRRTTNDERDGVRGE
jgi:hypothetical protein